jgi:LPS sulfotransferase NodH
VQEKRGDVPVGYDYQRILSWASHAAYCDRRWEAYFAFAGITPYRLTYEELASDYGATVDQLFRALGTWRSDLRISGPRMRRQADGRSEMLLRQFLEEHARRHAAGSVDAEQPAGMDKPVGEAD